MTQASSSASSITTSGSTSSEPLDSPVLNSVNDDLFEQVKLLSLELHSLIRQGVRQDIDQRIQHRNQLMQQWFSQVQVQIQLTDQQQTFLEDLLKEERALLHQLQHEQQKMTEHQTAARKLQSYKHHQ